MFNAWVVSEYNGPMCFFLNFFMGLLCSLPKVFCQSLTIFSFYGTSIFSTISLTLSYFSTLGIKRISKSTLYSKYKIQSLIGQQLYKALGKCGLKEVFMGSAPFLVMSPDIDFGWSKDNPVHVLELTTLLDLTCNRCTIHSTLTSYPNSNSEMQSLL